MQTATMKNGLPQGSVLVPTLFNMYKYDRQLWTLKGFFYVDDLALVSQGNSFENVKKALANTLEHLGKIIKQKTFET